MNQEQNHEEQHNQEHQGDVEQGSLEKVSAEQTQEPEHETSKNIIIIAVLAVIIVVLALMYIWGSKITEQQLPEVREDIVAVPPRVDEQTEALKQVSASNELVDIEKDLDKTELDSLDADLVELEAEIDAALVE